MSITKSYHDLCKEIDILYTRIKDLENEFHMWQRKMGGVGKKPIAPLDIALNRMKEICDLVETYVTILDEKEKTRKKIEQHMSEFEGVEYKVAYLRDVKGMTLPEVAVELGYSYDWIRKLSARTSRLKNGA